MPCSNFSSTVCAGNGQCLMNMCLCDEGFTGESSWINYRGTDCQIQQSVLSGVWGLNLINVGLWLLVTLPLFKYQFQRYRKTRAGLRSMYGKDHQIWNDRSSTAALSFLCVAFPCCIALAVCIIVDGGRIGVDVLPTLLWFFGRSGFYFGGNAFQMYVIALILKGDWAYRGEELLQRYMLRTKVVTGITVGAGMLALVNCANRLEPGRGVEWRHKLSHVFWVVFNAVTGIALCFHVLQARDLRKRTRVVFDEIIRAKNGGKQLEAETNSNTEELVFRKRSSSGMALGVVPNPASSLESTTGTRAVSPPPRPKRTSIPSAATMIELDGSRRYSQDITLSYYDDGEKGSESDSSGSCPSKSDHQDPSTSSTGFEDSESMLVFQRDALILGERVIEVHGSVTLVLHIAFAASPFLWRRIDYMIPFVWMFMPMLMYSSLRTMGQSSKTLRRKRFRKTGAGKLEVEQNKNTAARMRTADDHRTVDSSDASWRTWVDIEGDGGAASNVVTIEDLHPGVMAIGARSRWSRMVPVQEELIIEEDEEEEDEEEGSWGQQQQEL